MLTQPSSFRSAGLAGGGGVVRRGAVNAETAKGYEVSGDGDGVRTVRFGLNKCLKRAAFGFDGKMGKRGRNVFYINP